MGALPTSRPFFCSMHDLYLQCALHIPFKTIHNIQLYKNFKLETQDIAFREAKCCLTFALVSRSEMNGKNLLLAAAIIGTGTLLKYYNFEFFGEWRP
jgi:hypothetical protein